MLLDKLAESKEFCRATGGAFINKKRVRDRCFLNRFIVFYLYRCGKITDESGMKYVYKGDMDELLEYGLGRLTDGHWKKSKKWKCLC